MDIGMSNDGPSKMPCLIMIFKAFQAESVFFEDIGLVHAPARPYGALAPVELGFELRAVLDDPAVDGGVIHVDATFLHEFLDMTGAERVCEIPTDSHQNDLGWEMGTFETDRHRLAPS